MDLALYGALTGTVALLLSAIGAYHNLKDRPWLRLIFRFVPPRHGKIEPGGRHLIVHLANIGRRRALAYPPVVEYITLGDRFVSHEPDELWVPGVDWIPLEAMGNPPHLDKIEEYETKTYLYRLPPNVRVVRISVRDSLERCKNKYLLTGRFWLNVFRLRQFVRSWWTRGV